MSICTLTDSAKTQIDTLCRENSCYAISLNLKGGGCAGFEYEWGIVKAKEDLEENDEVIVWADHTLDIQGRFVIGSSSLMFLIGTEVDYVKSLVGSNFEIRNPNARSSCGCGVSVNFNDNVIPQILE